MASSSVQYHFVSKTASNFNICVVVHLGLAVFSSIYDTDVSAAIAVMGLIAVLNYNVGLLFLYLLFAPATMIVDIVRMVHVQEHYRKTAAGFFIFLRVVEMLVKAAATWFGYMVYTSASEGESGYEQINGGPGQSDQPSQSQQQPQQNPFAPAAYSAPPVTASGPVVHKMPPPSTPPV